MWHVRTLLPYAEEQLFYYCAIILPSRIQAIMHRRDVMLVVVLWIAMELGRRPQGRWMWACMNGKNEML